MRNVAVLSVEDGLALTVCDFYEWGGEIVLAAPPLSSSSRIEFHFIEKNKGPWEGVRGRGNVLPPSI